MTTYWDLILFLAAQQDTGYQLLIKTTLYLTIPKHLITQIK